MDNLKQVTNPYLPSWEYVPDGEPYVFGDRESVEEFWKEEYMHMYKAFWTLMYEYVNPLKHLY